MKNSKNPDQGHSHHPPTSNFSLVKKAGGSQVEIKNLQTFFQRILPLAIGLIIISLMGATFLGEKQGEGSGLLADLVRLASDHPGWSMVVKYIVIAVIAYFSWRIARLALGTLTMRVDQHCFQIKKGILGVGVFRSVPRSKIRSLKQVHWKEKQSSEASFVRGMVMVSYWRLELQGDRSLTILTNDTSPSDTDWLGQYLADWFNVPFEREDQ